MQKRPLDPEGVGLQNEVLRLLAEKNMHATFTGTAVGHSCHPVVQLGPVNRGQVSIRLLHLGSLDGRERSLPTILQFSSLHGCRVGASDLGDLILVCLDEVRCQVVLH